MIEKSNCFIFRLSTFVILFFLTVSTAVFGGGYSSSTVTTVSAGYANGQTDRPILRIAVTVSSGSGICNVTKLLFTTKNALSADVGNAKVFYTGTNSTFSSTTQFGATILNPNGDLQFTGAVNSLTATTVYFWLTYSVNNSAVCSDYLDALVKTGGITTTGSESGTHTPSTRDPEGASWVAISNCSVFTPGLTSNGCSGNHNINSFTFGTIASSGGCNNLTGGFIYYPQTEYTGCYVKGQSYTATIQVGSGAGNHSGAVWFDWNQDGDFQDVDEFYLVSNAINSSSVNNVVINVPLTANSGKVRMRIRYLANTTIVQSSATATVANGETEDYFISISTPPIITSQPVSVAGCEGGTVQFSTVATTDSNSGSLSYQWQMNTGTGFTNLANGSNFAGVTTNVLQVTAFTAALSNAQFRVVVSNAVAQTNSNSATLQVNSLPIILINGPTVICQNGGAVTYQTLAGQSNYTWAVTGGTIVSGGTTTSDFVTINWTNTGMQTVAVNYSNSFGCSANSAAALMVQVNEVQQLQVIGNVATLNQSICAGSAIVPIEVSYAGSATSINVSNLPAGLSYVWNGTHLVISGVPTTVGTTTFDLTTVGTNACSSTITVSITVNGVAELTLTSFPGSDYQVMCSAFNAGFSPVTYQSNSYVQSATVTGLPSGFSYTYNNGVVTIQGSSSIVGVYNYVVSATNSTTCAISASGTIEITSPQLMEYPGIQAGSALLVDGAQKVIVSDDCWLIGKIKDDTNGTNLGNSVMICSLDASAPALTADGMQFLRRNYQVSSISNSQSVVSFYFTQADFDDYNAINTGFVDLPNSGSNTDPNRPFLRYVRVVNGVNTLSTAYPDSLKWNGTHWVFNVPLTNPNDTFYFTTVSTCSGVAVSNVQIGAILMNSATVSWNAVSPNSASGYYTVRYRTASSAAWQIAGSTSNTATSFDLTGLAGATTYEVQVQRNCSSQTSGDWSASVFFTTLASPCSVAPTLSCTTYTNTAITVTWPLISGIASYELRYKLASSMIWTSAGTVAGTITSKTITGLSAGQTYYVQIRSTCSSGIVSAWSANLSVTTYAVNPCGSSVALTFDSITGSSARINWVAIPGAGWYEFRYKKATSTTWIDGGIVQGTSTSKILTGLSANTTYRVQSRTFCNSTTSSAWSSNYTFTTVSNSSQIATSEFNPESENKDMMNESSTAEDGITNALFHFGPNPVVNELTLQFLAVPQEKYNISVLDELGREVYRFEMESNSEIQTALIDLRAIKSGYYTVRILSENGIQYTTNILKMD
jgi:hypothetical protein